MQIASRSGRALAALALLVTSSISCGGGGDGGSTAPTGGGTVFLQPDSITLIAGESRQFTAEVRDPSGNVIAGRTINWTTSNDQRAIVSLSGLVVAVSQGVVRIRAASTGANADSATVVVRPKPVAAVDIVPADSLVLEVGLSSQLQVLLRDAEGNFLAGRSITWATTDGAKVEMSTSGRVTAVKPGRVQVSATSEGVTKSITVVSVQPSRDFSIRGALFTQGIQIDDNSVPTVAGTAAALVVLVSAAPQKNIPMEVVLRLTDANGAVIFTDTSTTIGATEALLTYQSPDVRFLVPPAFVRAGTRWQIVRDPRGRVGDDSLANDVFPRAGPQLLNAVTVPPVKVRFVPIILNAHNNIGGTVTTLTAPDFLRGMRAVYPMGTIEPTVGASVFSNLVMTQATQAAFYTALLGELDLARAMDAGDPQTYWHGVTPLAPAVTASVIGAGYIPADAQSTGAQSRTSVGLQTFITTTLAHEIGHNFGRRHAPCNAAADNPDPAFPSATGTIGRIAHDVFSWSLGLSTSPTAQAATTVDIMGPCGTARWVSSYTFNGVLNFRGFTAASARAGSVRAPAPAEPIRRSLIVRGSVAGGGDVRIEPAFVTDARATQPERTGNYRLEGRAADGRVLFARDFQPAIPGDGDGTGHFLFAIPVSTEDEHALTTIEVRGPVGKARLARPVRAAAIRAPSHVSIARASANQVTVACADPDARAILVRDGGTGAYLGSASSASMRVVAGAATPLVVTCSDGVASTAATVVAK